MTETIEQLTQTLRDELGDVYVIDEAIYYTDNNTGQEEYVDYDDLSTTGKRAFSAIFALLAR